MENKTIIYIDMDDTLCEYRKHYYEVQKLNPRLEYPQSIPNFYLYLEPIENAIGAYKLLESIENVELHIVTAPSVMNPLSYTEKRLWTEKHLGMKAAEDLIICGHKNLLIGDILIDDCTSGKGQDKFQGKLIHFNRPETNWNKILFSISKELKSD